MSNVMRRLGFGAALLCGLAVLAEAGDASAQATLSLEETKQCLRDDRDLQSQRNDLDARKPALDREADDLERMRRQVEAAQSAVFTGTAPSPLARADYEALRDRQYRDYDAYLARMKLYNADVARYNERLAEFNARCGGNRYSDYNLQEARRQLGW